MKKIKVEKIVKKFKLNVLLNKEYLNNYISYKNINIGSLEIFGYLLDFKNNENKKYENIKNSCFILGSKDKIYLKKIEKKQKINNYKNIFTNYNIPAMFIIDGFEDKDLINVIKNFKIPLIKIENFSLYEFVNAFIEYVSSLLLVEITYHASFINIFGKGTLIIGESGIGKSEVILELVKKKHLFIGDDSIVLIKKNNKIIGKSNKNIKNFLEIRGIGVINLSKLYGYQIILNESTVDIIIELVNPNKLNDFDRIGNEYHIEKIWNIEIPKIILPVKAGRNISELIETSIEKFKTEEFIGNTLFNELNIQLKNNKNNI